MQSANRDAAICALGAAAGAAACWLALSTRTKKAHAEDESPGLGEPLPYVAAGLAYVDWNATSPIFPEARA